MNRRRFTTSLVATATAPALFAVHSTSAQAPTPPSDAQEAIFIEAVDGEKMKVKIGDKEEEVRLIACDAPEVKNEDGHPECGFEESKQLLAKYVAGRRILLEKDAEDRDGKRRLWRHVWVSASDGVNFGLFNEILLETGWVTIQPEEKNTKHAERYQLAAQAAKENQAGLYAKCGGHHVAAPPRGSGENPGSVGETLVGEGVAVTLNDAFRTYDYNYSTPKGGYVFLILNVTLQNNGEDEKGYSDTRFSAKDLDTGAEFDDTFALLDAPLGRGDLSTGEYVTGQVALEIQETAVNVRVKYQISALGGESVYWLVPQ